MDIDSKFFTPPPFAKLMFFVDLWLEQLSKITVHNVQTCEKNIERMRNRVIQLHRPRRPSGAVGKMDHIRGVLEQKKKTFNLIKNATDAINFECSIWLDHLVTDIFGETPWSVIAKTDTDEVFETLYYFMVEKAQHQPNMLWDISYGMATLQAIVPPTLRNRQAYFQSIQRLGSFLTHVPPPPV